MSKIIKVREVNFGEGKPKVCVPMIGRTELELREEIELVMSCQCDLVEWRADFFDGIDDYGKVIEVLGLIRNLLGEKPLLFTCRTKKEGGEKDISGKEYVDLYKKVIEAGKVDMIDAELYQGDDICKELVALAHKFHVSVVMSNHDFQKTPSKKILLERFEKMRALGADMPKIAAMPVDTGDVLELLCATNEFSEYADCPVISMSMAWKGCVSRISGEFFGSAVTFAAAKNASAPGQISVNDMNDILDILHNTHKE